MGRTIRWRWAAAPLAALLLVTAACGDDDKKDDAAGTTSTSLKVPDGIVVGAGINDPGDANVAVLEFLPEKITVAVGTDVTWEWNGTEPHSVTFVPEGEAPPDVEKDPTAGDPVPPTGPIDGTALVSSGLLPAGPTPAEPVTSSFAKAGTYSYLCLIHPTMTGEVEVVDAGATADTPTDVAKRRAAETDEYLAEGRAAKADLIKAEPSKEANADGSSTWTVEMGTTTEHTDVLAFAPTPVGVKAGDTVTFVNNSKAPHTATFFGTDAPKDIQSPFDPRVLAPAPGPSPQALDATGYFNSGWLPTEPKPLSDRSFSFTVPTAGTYSYVCVLHAPSGMTGSISATT